MMAVVCKHFFYKLHELCVNTDILSFFSFSFLIHGILRHSDNVLIKVTTHLKNLNCFKLTVQTQ